MQLLAAQWVLGLLPSEALPEIATRVLVDGYDTPALRQLAGATQPSMAGSAPTSEKALLERGIGLPTKTEAGLLEVASNSRLDTETPSSENKLGEAFSRSSPASAPLRLCERKSEFFGCGSAALGPSW